MAPLKFKRQGRVVVVEGNLKALHQMGKGNFGASFQIRNVRLAEADPGSLKDGFFVHLASEEHQYCVYSAFEDEHSERIPLNAWKHFENVTRSGAAAPVPHGQRRLPYVELFIEPCRMLGQTAGFVLKILIYGLIL